jgi:hypothetical protein
VKIMRRDVCQTSPANAISLAVLKQRMTCIVFDVI